MSSRPGAWKAPGWRGTPGRNLSAPRLRAASQQGAALAYVVGLLAIFGLLIGLVIRYTRFNDTLVSRDRWDAQARQLAASGVDLAMSRLDPPGPAFHPGFSSEGIQYNLDNPELSFRVRVASRGLMARVESRGLTRLPHPGRHKDGSALVGQGLDLARLPAVGLLNREGNMVLAGNSQVTGPVMLWRGGVRKATDYHVRWTGQGGHAGPAWDSAAAAWKLAEPDWSRAEDWMEAQNKVLGSGDASEDPDYDSGMIVDYPPGDSIVLGDTALAGVRVRAGRILKVGSGAVLVDCKLMAPEIVIEGDAELEGVLAFASRELHLRGGEIRGGHFTAMDSIRIDLERPLSGWPVFYVRGRRENAGKPDSSYRGCLRVDKAKGEGLFLASLSDRPVWDQEVRMLLGSGADLSGLFYCNGYAGVEGRLKGSLLCRNLKFEYKGTIWLGHLKDARIESFTGSKAIPAPLLFPGFPLLTLTEAFR